VNHRSGYLLNELHTTRNESQLNGQPADDITAQLNQFYETEDSSLDEVVKQLQAISLPPEEW
jgi:hypothetical protein